MPNRILNKDYADSHQSNVNQEIYWALDVGITRLEYHFSNFFLIFYIPMGVLCKLEEVILIRNLSKLAGELLFLIVEELNVRYQV